jgi:hypothetical protein
MDQHDRAALTHYEQLIELRYPPQLAALLAAARYQLALIEAPALPIVRSALVAVQEAHPDLRRDAGRTVAAIDRRKIKAGNNRGP